MSADDYRFIQTTFEECSLIQINAVESNWVHIKANKYEIKNIADKFTGILLITDTQTGSTDLRQYKSDRICSNLLIPVHLSSNCSKPVQNCKKKILKLVESG